MLLRYKSPLEHANANNEEDKYVSFLSTQKKSRTTRWSRGGGQIDEEL